jgi:UDP-N-acetylglucosamine 1-carboxyvinyltransferase
MGKYYISGGKKLNGETTIDGAKNAVLPILAATVLNSSINCIHNCPKILDSKIMVEILTAVGCKVICEGNTIIVDSSFANSYEVPEKPVKEMRSSIIFLGSMIGRFKKAIVTYPGGCELGPRPIDLHLKALKQMGILINESNGFIVCEAKEIIGTNINLDFPSVGATENIMLAAVLAKGRTIINNAAKEPEIVDLQNFLLAMGAKVYGAGTDRIFIDGVEKLHEVEYSVMPDRIVAGTLLIAGAITKGEILINNACPSHIYSVISKLKECGCSIVETPNSIYLKSSSVLNSVDIIRTHPYPGFPTDMQPQFMTLLTLAKGTSIMIETVFESRYKHVSELIRMGANISLDGRTAIIKGVEQLRPAKVTAMDLRGGAALILAGLVAQGETIVDNSKHIERGYESIEESLTSLGADIKLVH